MPVQLGGLVLPEGFRVLEGLAVYFILKVCHCDGLEGRFVQDEWTFVLWYNDVGRLRWRFIVIGQYRCNHSIRTSRRVNQLSYKGKSAAEKCSSIRTRVSERRPSARGAPHDSCMHG